MLKETLLSADETDSASLLPEGAGKLQVRTRTILKGYLLSKYLL